MLNSCAYSGVALHYSTVSPTQNPVLYLQGRLKIQDLTLTDQNMRGLTLQDLTMTDKTAGADVASWVVDRLLRS